MKKTLVILILIIAVFEINAQDICKEQIDKLFALKESIDQSRINTVINQVFNSEGIIHLGGDNYSQRIFVKRWIIKGSGLSSYSIVILANDKRKVIARYRDGLVKNYVLYFSNDKISKLTTEHIDNYDSKIETLNRQKRANSIKIKSLETERDSLKENSQNSDENRRKLSKVHIDYINGNVNENIFKIISNTQNGELINNLIKDDSEARLKIILDSYKNYRGYFGRIDKEIQEQNSLYIDSLAQIIRITEGNESCITLWEKETEGNRKGNWKSYSATFDNIVEFMIRNPIYKYGYTMYALIDSSALKLDATFRNDEKSKLRINNYFFTDIVLAPKDYHEDIEKQTTPIGFFTNRYISDKIPLSKSTLYKGQEMTLEQALPLIKNINFKIQCDIKVGNYIIGQTNEILTYEQIEALEQEKYTINKIHIIEW